MNMRDRRIDILRGFAVIFVVLGHCGFPLSRFLYQFHTALFFIVSGFFWQQHYSDNIAGIKNLVVTKLKTLWLPYVLWNGIFLILNNPLCISGFYLSNETEWAEVMQRAGAYEIHRILSLKDTLLELIKICLFMGGTELGGASWFFRVLFFGLIAFGVWEFLLRKLTDKYMIVECVLGIIFSLMGRCCGNIKTSFNGKMGVLMANMEVCLMAYALLVVGKVFHILLQRYIDNKIAIVIFAAGLVISVLLYNSEIEFFGIAYGITVSVFGWMMIWGQSYFVDKYLNIIARPIAYMGRNTVPIFMGHFAAFKIINVLVTKIESLPHYYSGAFTTVYGQKYWIIYSIAGCLLPLIFNYLNFQIVGKCRKFLQNR